MQLRRALVFLVMAWASFGAWSQNEALRFSASTSWGMPYAEVRDDQLVGGIVFDLTQAISAAMQEPVRYVVLPRKRLEAATLAGETDVRCYFNPAWTKYPDQYLFSAALFDVSDVLVGAPGTQAITNVADLPKGTTVGRVLGYVYPNLEHRFNAQSLLREDARDMEKVLKKLGRGRNSYAVVNSRVLAWLRRQSAIGAIAHWSLPLERTYFYCAVRKDAAPKTRAVLETINRLKASGQIDKILQSYQ